MLAAFAAGLLARGAARLLGAAARRRHPLVVAGLGAAAQPAIDTLNTQISAFLGAISNGEPPSGSDWEQTNNPIARVLTK